MARTVAVGGVACSLVACGFSKLDSNASVHLTGKVLDAAGHPASGARVLLFKEADLGEVVFGLTFAVASLGLICLTPVAPSVCAGARTATSAGDGSVAYDLKGSDTQGSIGGADTFAMTALAPAAPGGAMQASTVRFEIQHAQLDLPPLRIWDAAPSLAPGPTELRVGWPSLPADGYGSSPGYTVRFIDPVSNRDVWTVARVSGGTIAGPSSGTTVDPHLIEDHTVSVEVDALTSTPAPDTELRFLYASRVVRETGTTGAPPSRGAPCFLQGASGQAVPVTPCKLTDGDLTSSRALQGTCSGCTAEVHTAAGVDLGRSRPITLVVVRGGAGQMLVETSDDAHTWTIAGQGSGDLVSVGPTSAHGRYVRVRSSSGLDVSGLRQLSVWS